MYIFISMIVKRRLNIRFNNFKIGKRTIRTLSVALNIY